MTKSEMLQEISILQETLVDCVLTIADKVAIRNEIGDLQDKVALLDFQESEDIDFGHHSEWE
ncbi:MAG: hypothetical protein CMK37_08290 [Porticoccaceae bacterium]|nr:hypothetical protein [Porticoccaceae bacterium]